MSSVHLAAANHGMRILAIAFLTTTSCMAGTARLRSAPGAAGDESAAGTNANLAAARELDREGVRSFRDGRYVDAVRYFGAAFELGGPSSELWNLARARERLDDAEGAASAVGEYLARRDLTPQDRADAEREAQALHWRSSVLTVTTNPAGAVVTVDGKQSAGPTPLSIEVPAGAHAIAVRRDGYVVETRSVQARFGRAIIVSLDLQRSAN